MHSLSEAITGQPVVLILITELNAGKTFQFMRSPINMWPKSHQRNEYGKDIPIHAITKQHVA
jgi:hypothetical protein